MNPILNQNTFLVKEQVGMFKAANNYDVYNPEDESLLLQCREDNLGFFTKMLRFTKYKRMTPFHIEIKTAAGQKLLTVKRGVSFFTSTVEVLNEQDELIGLFKQKLFSIGGKFNVLDAQEQPLCTLQGKWTSWEFKFINNNTEYGQVTKKWAGLGKELFTSADNYVLQIAPSVAKEDPIRPLILAAVFCIDMVLKE